MKTIPRIVPRDVTQSNIDIHRTSPLTFLNLLLCTYLTSASNLIINISKPLMMPLPSTNYSVVATGRSPSHIGATPILHSSRCIGAALFRSPHRNGKARGRSPRRNGAALSHSPRRGGTDPNLPPARLYLPLLRHSPELPRHPPLVPPRPLPPSHFEGKYSYRYRLTPL